MKYFRIVLKLAFSTIFCMSLLSCAPHYRTYDGLPKEQNEIAMLVGIHKYTSFKNEDVIVQIVSVDKKQGFRGSRWDGEYEIELLPGLHEIEVRFRGHSILSTETLTLSFNAEPGRTYTVKPNLSKDFKNWSPSIINITDKME